MKRILSCLLVFLMLFSASAFAENAVEDTSFRVFFDGQEITFPDEKTYVHSNRYLYVPIRPISEALGYDVSWDGETKTVTLRKGDRIATFTVGGKMYVNDVEKQARVNFPLINGRVFVSQYGICHALDCTMSWDDINRVLYFYSNEKHPLGIDFSQNSHVGANVKGEEFQEFYSVAEPAFLLPGLNEHIIPQGVAYRKDTNQFYLTGYFQAEIKNRNSSIIVIDAETGIITNQYQLLQQDGSLHSGHVGGIAISEKDIYLTDNQNIQRIPLASIDSHDSTGYLKVEENIHLTLGEDCNNAYIECSDGYLWVGNYFYEGHPSYGVKKAHSSYPFLIRGYKLDPTQPSGLNVERKIENNEWYDYIPDVIYSVNKDRIQGMTTVGDYLITASSGSNKTINPSYLHIYNITKSSEPGDDITLEDGTVLPVIRLSCEKTVTTMPYMEEITYANNNLYAAFESGAVTYRTKANTYKTDSVWKIDIEKLLAPSSK